MDSGFLWKFITKQVVLGVALSQMFTVQATPESEGFEMAASFVSIPVKIAARHCAYKNNVKAAALLNVTADTLNICRDVLYFWNQSLEARRHYSSSAFTDGGVYAAVNGAMTIRDLVKWSQHLGECMGFKRAVPASDDDDFVDFDDDANEVAATKPADAAADEEKIGRLAYAWQVITLPTLEGLTAFAVAFSQQSGLDWETSPAFRRMATAAHSFVRLLDEKAMLKSDSPRKEKALYALLMANAIWLAYEIYRFSNPPRPLSATPVWHHDGNDGDAAVVDPAPATVVAADVKPAAVVVPQVPAPLPVLRVHENPVNCRMCELLGADDPKLTDQKRVTLGCGHIYCKDCFLRQVTAARDDKESKTAMAAIRCPAGEGRNRCRYVMTADDIRQITEDRATFNAYAEAADVQALMTMPGMKHCPMPDCNGQFIYEIKVPWLHTCNGMRKGQPCGARYCASCLRPHDLRVRCADVKAPVDATSAAQLDAAWLATHTRQCPRCHMGIQKNDGCNHMTCRRDVGGCGHEFCWLCLEDCYDHGDHFKLGRCRAQVRSSMACPSCHKNVQRNMTGNLKDPARSIEACTCGNYFCWACGQECPEGRHRYGSCTGRWFDHGEDDGGALKIPART